MKSVNSKSDAILEARHLVKHYTQRSGKFGFGKTTIKALDDVSVTLKKGQHSPL